MILGPPEDPSDSRGPQNGLQVSTARQVAPSEDPKTVPKSPRQSQLVRREGKHCPDARRLSEDLCRHSRGAGRPAWFRRWESSRRGIGPSTHMYIAALEDYHHAYQTVEMTHSQIHQSEKHEAPAPWRAISSAILYPSSTCCRVPILTPNRSMSRSSTRISS